MTQSQEDYLEMISFLSLEGEVRITDIAKRLGISKPAAFTAVKTLEEKALITHKRYSTVSLTGDGKKLQRIFVNGTTCLPTFCIEFWGSAHLQQNLMHVKWSMFFQTKHSSAWRRCLGAFECNGLKAGCGACTLSYMEYDSQIKQKHDMLRKTMLHGNIFDVLPEIQIVPSAVTEYRNRIQLHNANTPCVSVKKNIRKLSAQKIQNVSFGFMNHRGNDVVVIDDCPICDPVIRNALQNKTLKPSLDKDRWTVYGRDNLLISETCRLCGKYDFLGRQIKVSAASFFQSNGKLLEKLISDVIHVSEQADHDLICGDFYCGVGTFGVFLQEVFSSLVLFDQNKAAMQLAKENVKRCGTQFFAMDDDKFVKHSRVKGQYGFVVLDPARKGLSNLMTKWLCENKPKIICYVSCNPSALARDSKYLLQAGYTLRSLTYYDFYPHTVHIESLAVFD